MPFLHHGLSQESPLPLGTSLPGTSQPFWLLLCDGSSWIGSWLLLSWHADTPLSQPWLSFLLQWHSCLGFSDHSWVEGSPLRTELILRDTPGSARPTHLLSLVSSHYFNTMLVKKNVLDDLSQKHFLLLMAFMQPIHTLFSIT